MSVITQHPPGVRSAICRWAEDQRGEGGKKKLENNWFCRHLEHVQMGHLNMFRLMLRGWKTWVLLRLLKHKTEQSCILQKCLQGCFTSVFLPTICYHYYYKNWVLAFEILGSELPLIVPWEEKYIHKKTIWLIKDMNKRSYMACVCFILHCSQLASNCGIKGMFVSLFLKLKAPSWSIMLEDCCCDILLHVCANTDSFFNCQPPMLD